MRSAAIALLALTALPAAEYKGVVTFGGLPVPGATVTVTQGEKKLTAVTDAEGAYKFRDLADGAWNFQIEMLCFTPIKQEVTIVPGAPLPAWELKLLPLDEIKAAAAAAPSVAMPAASPPRVAVNPETPAPRQQAKGKSKKHAEQPTAAANGQAAGFQRTDVKASADPNAIASEPSGPVTADQARNASDVFAINGSVNNGAASPFAQAPAFGNNRRGTRSLYQAALGITVDNAAWDAQSYSLSGQNTPKPAYNLLQGTASFGGPIRWFPKIFGQNAPNVFFGYQWTRNRNASTLTGLMPDAAERSGDLSHLLNPLGQPVQVFDPTTGAPFAGNVIPAGRISQQARSLLNYYPLPNFNANARYNYQIPTVGGMHQDGMSLNVDKTLTRRNQISGNFAFQRTASDAPNLFGFTDRTSMLGLTTGINWSHRFNQRLYTRFGYKYSRSNTTLTPYFANLVNVSGNAGIAGNNQDPLYWGPPALSFAGGISGLNDGQPSHPRAQSSGVTTDDYWSRGPHNVKFGGEFRRQQINLLSQQNARGSFGFTGAAAGSDFGGFLLGVPDTSSIAFGNADKYFRSSAYTAYIADDWRMNSSLTLNIGIRWEYGSPISELYGRLVNLDIVPGFRAVAPVLGSSPVGSLTGQHYPDSLVRPDRHGFQPRVGIAWRPLPASSMVIRAGYGIYYNTSVYNLIAGSMAQQSPLSKSLSVQGTKDHPLSMANGFNESPAITPNTYAVDPNFLVGYAQNWDVSIQRDLPGALVVTAMYLGIKGTRAQQEFLPNTVPLGAAPCSGCPTGFAYVTSNGNSTREAGQLQIRRRMHNGIAASLQYTYSKSIDDAALGGRTQAAGSGGQGTGGMGSASLGQTTAVIAQDWLNLAGERGLSNFDQRHVLTLQAQYSTGMGMGGGALMSGWRGALFKEWTITTNINAASGLPQTPIYIAAVQGTGVTGSIRPSYTGAPLYDAPESFALNPSAVMKPLPGQWGNAGRNSITGPAQFSLDASLGRTFRLTDRINADLRLDSSNALNHVTYQSWNTNINNAQFGLPTAANRMRMSRIGLRVRF